MYNHSNTDLFTKVWRNITRILTEEFSKAAQSKFLNYEFMTKKRLLIMLLYIDIRLLQNNIYCIVESISK